MTNVIDEVFDASLQKTQIWFNDLMPELDWEDQPKKAYLALRTVLHALRDPLSAEEALQLAAQLPTLIRGVYFEGWNLKDKPRKERHREEFLKHVTDAFRDDININAERITRAVFKLLAKHISKGEIDDVKRILPHELRELWPGEQRL